MSVKKNAIANYAGQAWIAFISIIFVPIYINKLGIAAFGLIGIYTILQTWVSLLDFGITPTITRELSKLHSKEHSLISIKNLIYSFELIIYAISAGIILVLSLGSNLIAHYWLSTNSNFDVQNVVLVFSFVIAFRFCEGIYRGGLIGLEKHFTLNKIQIFFNTLRFVGAAIVVTFYPSILYFFLWQAAISFLTIFTLRKSLNKFIGPAHKKPQFSLAELHKVKKFAGGMTLTNIIGLAYTQADKIIVSTFLGLEDFGAYMLAFTISGILPMLTYPIISTISPKLNIAVATKNKSDEILLFNFGSQITTILTTPICVACVLFSHQILFAWTNNLEVVAASSHLLSLVILGTYCNALLLTPFALQQAHGWTTLSITINFVGLASLFAISALSLRSYGVNGIAFAWGVSNFLILLIATYKMHLKLLPDELRPFLLKTIIQPVTISLITAIPAGMYFQYSNDQRELTILGIAVYLITTTVLIMISLPIRQQISKSLFSFIK